MENMNQMRVQDSSGFDGAYEISLENFSDDGLLRTPHHSFSTEQDGGYLSQNESNYGEYQETPYFQHPLPDSYSPLDHQYEYSPLGPDDFPHQLFDELQNDYAQNNDIFYQPPSTPPNSSKWQYPAAPRDLGSRRNGAGCPPKHNIDFTNLNKAQTNICQRIWEDHRREYEALLRQTPNGGGKSEIAEYVSSVWKKILKRLRNQISVHNSRNTKQQGTQNAVRTLEKMLTALRNAPRTNPLRKELDDIVKVFQDENGTTLLEVFRKAAGSEDEPLRRRTRQSSRT